MLSFAVTHANSAPPVILPRAPVLMMIPIARVWPRQAEEPVRAAAGRAPAKEMEERRAQKRRA